VSDLYFIGKRLYLDTTSCEYGLEGREEIGGDLDALKGVYAGDVAGEI
jgi:hypothetical protein